MTLMPYLFFEGRCEEAMDHYKGIFGAKVVMMMRYRESPEQPPAGSLPPGSEDKVMHAELQIGDAKVMMSDGGVSGEAKFSGVSLAHVVKEVATAERVFAELADGGHVQMPLARTFWSPAFGMVADRFGVSWMIMVDARPSNPHD